MQINKKIQFTENTVFFAESFFFISNYVSEPVALAGVNFPTPLPDSKKIPPPLLEDGELAGDQPLLEPKEAAGANFDIADDLKASDSMPIAVS